MPPAAAGPAPQTVRVAVPRPGGRPGRKGHRGKRKPINININLKVQEPPPAPPLQASLPPPVDYGYPAPPLDPFYPPMVDEDPPPYSFEEKYEPVLSAVPEHQPGLAFDDYKLALSASEKRDVGVATAAPPALLDSFTVPPTPAAKLDAYTATVGPKSATRDVCTSPLHPEEAQLAPPVWGAFDAAGPLFLEDLRPFHYPERRLGPDSRERLRTPRKTKDVDGRWAHDLRVGVSYHRDKDKAVSDPGTPREQQKKGVSFPRLVKGSVVGVSTESMMYRPKDDNLKLPHVNGAASLSPGRRPASQPSPGREIPVLVTARSNSIFGPPPEEGDADPDATGPLPDPDPEPAKRRARRPPRDTDYDDEDDDDEYDQAYDSSLSSASPAPSPRARRRKPRQPPRRPSRRPPRRRRRSYYDDEYDDDDDEYDDDEYDDGEYDDDGYDGGRSRKRYGRPRGRPERDSRRHGQPARRRHQERPERRERRAVQGRQPQRQGRRGPPGGGGKRRGSVAVGLPYQPYTLKDYKKIRPKDPDKDKEKARRNRVQKAKEYAEQLRRKARGGAVEFDADENI